MTPYWTPVAEAALVRNQLAAFATLPHFSISARI